MWYFLWLFGVFQDILLTLSVLSRVFGVHPKGFCVLSKLHSRLPKLFAFYPKVLLSFKDCLMSFLECLVSSDEGL